MIAFQFFVTRKIEYICSSAYNIFTAKEMRQRTILKRIYEKKIILKRRYKMAEIFDYNDLIDYILEFSDEREKIALYRVNMNLRDFVFKSRLCPIYFKFSDQFFVNNLANQRILDIYRRNYDLFENIFSLTFLKKYCICQNIVDCQMFHISTKVCVPCELYNHPLFRGCCYYTLLWDCGATGLHGPSGYLRTEGLINRWNKRKEELKNRIVIHNEQIIDHKNPILYDYKSASKHKRHYR
ncbi:MAG: hypothetical protein Harvfovirus46_5 [Harvfovirus sp.]|uniref:Uncharacterized protein n=1 Tax=Harvfovirus sp. TaxID=2487768 RepID=A0A3G5A321_9VIRU|nr:MAG: hypothetical protein Harvfovirus46_5 [Harvfovirus sp.]